MTKRIHVGLFFGGRSSEHEVSVTSARSVLDAIDPARYQVTLIGIDKRGQWCIGDDRDALLGEPTINPDHLTSVILDPYRRLLLVRVREGWRPLDDRPLDVALPILHGPFGEDGTIQGLFELAGLPYVGSGVLGSAVGMDKEMMKRAFSAADLPMVGHHVIREHDWAQTQSQTAQAIDDALGFPVFVKPANMGSSVGVTRVDGPNGLPGAVEFALRFDDKALVEQAVTECREVECAVLGNEAPQASCLGEIRPNAEFYDYDAKYVDDSSELIIPAPLSDTVTDEIRDLSLRAFAAVGASGLARVDFFVDGSDRVYLNEINTLPGFTPISMYPKLWAHSGLPYPQLIDRLIALGLERAERRHRRATDR
ncbi:MAG: D-alanine--D-alanine ligase family protein [Pseudomonadota bacterium]